MSYSGATYSWFRYFSLGLFFAWVASTLLVSASHGISAPPRLALQDKAGIALLLFLIYFAAMGIHDAAPLYVIRTTGSYLLTFSPLIIFQYYYNKSVDQLLQIGLTAAGVVVAYTAANLVFFASNPFVARAIASQQPVHGIFLGAGYYVAFAAAIGGVFLFELWKHQRHKTLLRRLSFLLLLLMSVAVVALAGSTITMVAMACGIALSMILRNKNRVANVIFVIIFLLLLPTIRTIVGGLIVSLDSHPYGIVATRVREVGDMILFGTTSGSGIDARGDTLLRSITVFLDHPILGIGYLIGNDPSLAKLQFDFGDHSEIFDLLAMHGVLGFSFLAFIMWRVFARLRLVRPGVGLLPTLITIGVMIVWNPFFCFQVNLLTMLVMPVLLLTTRVDSAHEHGGAADRPTQHNPSLGIKSRPIARTCDLTGIPLDLSPSVTYTPNERGPMNKRIVVSGTSHSILRPAILATTTAETSQVRPVSSYRTMQVSVPPSRNTSLLSLAPRLPDLPNSAVVVSGGGYL